MATVELRHLAHSYGKSLEPGAFAIEGLNVTWDDGTANALLGPSGCGKTTLLNILSGLLRPTDGAVLLDGLEVTDRTPGERQIAQVFQFPVVYETMNVFDNLAFPLRNRRLGEDTIRKRVEEIAELLELGALLKTGAGRLGPAEKQLVSLGRGIVRKDTAAVLLDEPLTVIDPVQKPDLRRRLRDVQRELRVTMLYVTHDQHEALTFADRVTVMNQGAVVQTATPEELFLHPETTFVGHFIGSPGMNTMACGWDAGAMRLDGVPWVLPQPVMQKARSLRGEVRLGIRPEFVETSCARRDRWTGCGLADVDFLGAYQVLTLELAGLRIKAVANERFDARIGAEVWVNFPEDKIRLYEDEKLVH